MEDVAREAGVSRSLVSIAFRGAPGVSARRREQIFSAASRLGYRPNRVASRLASKAPKVLGVFLQDLRNDVFADIFDGIRDVADLAGAQLVLAAGAVDGGRDEAMLDTLAESRVGVVIAAGLMLDDVQVQQASTRVPIVSVARRVPGVSSVSADDRSGAYEAVRHLLTLGHTQIAFMANPQTDGYRDRLVGYRAAMADAGRPALVVRSSYSRDEAARDATEVLSAADAPTAIFAHNDRCAFGVLDAAFSLSIPVPANLSVVGFDNSSASSVPGRALTTVDLHGRTLGRVAAQIALARVDDPLEPVESRVFASSLVVRQTTAPPARPCKFS